MKRKVIIALFIAVAVLLAACGGSRKPDSMTQDTYDNGCRALEIMEKYNSADISKEDAKDRLENIQRALDSEREGLDDLILNTDNFLVSLTIKQFLYAVDGLTSVNTIDEEKELRELLGK